MDISATIREMLARGTDPKEIVTEACKPQCKGFEEKLGRCESKLKEMKGSNAELSCMYPFRDWVTCVDACVNPAIQRHLVGNEKGFIS
jgi:ubiquinol-cytochrome c reductase subunit 6